MTPRPGEIVLTGQTPSSTIRSGEREGRLQRVHSGIYIAKSPARKQLTDSEIEEAMRRSWREVLAHEVSGTSIVTDRSAPPAGPTPSGELYVVTPGRARRRVMKLPGLTILTRDGPPPDPQDAPLARNVWLASHARALIENTARSRRTRDGSQPRTLSETEIGDWIDKIASRSRGTENLLHVRNEIDRLSATGAYAGTVPEVPSRLIGAALGTRDIETGSLRLASRISGRPFDAHRVELFDRLADRLARTAPKPLSAPDPTRAQLVPFYEAYFSNFIEGTEFTIDEAYDVVFNGADLDRPDDAHDVRGTWRVTSNLDEMSNLAATSNEFCDMLRRRHTLVMSSRTDKHPGEFKDRSNRVGGIEFVAPAEVKETLRIGWANLDRIADSFQRACYTMFLIAEVHPFVDGNGRVARLFMNAELVAANQPRVIIPTVYRNNYLAALSGVSHDNNPDALARVLSFAQQWVSAGEWDNRDRAERYLHASDAYETPAAEQSGQARLRIPDPADLHGIDPNDLPDSKRRPTAAPVATKALRCGIQTRNMKGPCVLDRGHQNGHSSTGRQQKHR